MCPPPGPQRIPPHLHLCKLSQSAPSKESWKRANKRDLPHKKKVLSGCILRAGNRCGVDVEATGSAGPVLTHKEEPVSSDRTQSTQKGRDTTLSLQQSRVFLSL